MAFQRNRTFLPQLLGHRRIGSAARAEALLSVKGARGPCCELMVIPGPLIRLFKADKGRQAHHLAETSWADGCSRNAVIGVAGGEGFLGDWSRPEMLSDGSGGEPAGIMKRGRCAAIPAPTALLNPGAVLPSAA